MIKILFVGDSSYEIYVKALYNAALKMKGVNPILFDFGCLNIIEAMKSIVTKIEYRYRIGCHVKKLNRSLIKICKDETLDIVFLYSCPFIYAETVEKIRRLGIYTAIYHNDNPFSYQYNKMFWKIYRDTISKADISYAYRKGDIPDYYKFGAKRVELLRSYYINERNYYIADNKIDMDIPNVVFMGHYENDGRLDYIEDLLNNNISIGVSDLWKVYISKRRNLIFLSSEHNKYNEILNKAKIAVVFLSTRNKDTYTRRCFEIPVVRTMMIAPYNADLAELFNEEKEVVFYRNKKEFVDKIKYFLEHEKERKNIADAGYRRVLKDGQEVYNRLEKIIFDYQESKKLI